MRTGRPREFCKEHALDRAMAVFWRQGYEGASLADLTAAMGISPPSLYACFGNKEGLFRAVLEHYDQRRAAFMHEVLSRPTAQEVAETFVHGVAEFAAGLGGKTPPGCLLVQSGLSSGDSEIPDQLARHRAEKEKALAERFERAKHQGDLDPDADPLILARYLSVLANGICVQAAAGATVEQLHEIAELALAGWPGRVRHRTTAIKGSEEPLAI